MIKTTITTLLAFLLVSPALAQKTKTTLQKPPIGVKGAGQLAGGTIRFGELFALKSGFTYQILSARYSLDPFDDYSRETVKREEKFVILTVAIKNNRKEGDNYFDPASHFFQLVDAAGDNHEGGAYKLKSKPGEGFSPNLKPGQGLGQTPTDPVEVAIKVPATARIVKLILKQGREGTQEEVLRFFIAGATEAEAGGKPDPKNIIAPLPESATPGKILAPGTLLPTGAYYFRVESFATADKLGQEEPEEGKRWILAKVTVKGGQSNKQPLFDFFGGDDIANLVLVDTDGEKYPASRFLKASKDENAEGELTGGEERAFRIGFQVPKDAKFKTVLLGSPSGHLYLFDASGIGK